MLCYSLEEMHKVRSIQINIVWLEDPPHSLSSLDINTTGNNCSKLK
jgi:hypothetical protein